MAENSVARFWRWVVVVLLLGAVASCASLSGAPPEEVVRQRAQQRWDALIAGDWDRAYGLMTPSYRAVMAKSRFGAQFSGAVSWQKAEVVGVTCLEERCTVRMKVTVRPLLGGQPGELASTHFDETWVREDGQWWMFQRI